jgi:hypothetical protein
VRFFIHPTKFFANFIQTIDTIRFYSTNSKTRIILFIVAIRLPSQEKEKENPQTVVVK